MTITTLGSKTQYCPLVSLSGPCLLHGRILLFQPTAHTLSSRKFFCLLPQSRMTNISHMPGHSHFGGHSEYRGKLPRFPFQDPCIFSLSCHKCWPLMAHNCIFSENGFAQRELPCPKFQPTRVNVGVNRRQRLVLRPGTLSHLGQPSSRDPLYNCLRTLWQLQCFILLPSFLYKCCS